MKKEAHQVGDEDEQARVEATRYGFSLDRAGNQLAF